MSNNLAITNGTTVDFLVIDSTASQGSGSSSASASATVLKQLMTTTGASAIKAGQTGSVALNDTYIDPTTNQSTPSLLYQLIPSTTDWFSPIKNLGIMQDLMTGSYDPVTVSEADYTAMQSAITFANEIMVYPSSTLATGYNNAVNSAVTAANPGQTATSASASVDAYLQTTSDYKSVTFEMVVAAQAYMNNYPFAWTRKQASMTYYLYTANGTTPIAAQGQVLMTKAANGAPKVSDSNGGYKFIYTDPKGKTTALFYQNGLFVDQVNSDTPNIALQGQLTLKSRLTGSTSDDSVISVLSGTLQGLTVMGFDTLQTTGADTRGFWATLFDPQSAEEAFNSFLQIGNALMIFKELGGGLSKIVQKLRGKTPKKPVTAKDLSDLRDKITADTEKLISKKAGKNAKMQPTDVKDAEAESKTSVDTEDTLSEKSGLEGELKSEASELETVAEDSAPTAQMESDASSIRTEESVLEKASTPDQVAKAVETESPKIDNIGSSLKSIETTEAKSVAAQQKAQMAEEEQVSEEAASNEKKLQQEAEETEHGSEPVEEDFHIE